MNSPAARAGAAPDCGRRKGSMRSLRAMLSWSARAAPRGRRVRRSRELQNAGAPAAVVCALDRGGEVAAVGDLAGGVAVWDVAAERVLAKRPPGVGGMGALGGVCVVDGGVWAVAEGKRIVVWKADVETWSTECNGMIANDVALSRDGAIVVAAFAKARGAGGELVVSYLEDGGERQTVARVFRRPHAVHRVVVNDAGSVAAFFWWNGRGKRGVECVDVGTGASLMNCSCKGIPGLSMDAAGDYLAIADAKSLRICPTREHRGLVRLLPDFAKTTGDTAFCAITQDAAYVVAAVGRSLFRVWDTNTGVIIASLDSKSLCHSRGCAVSGDGTCILTCSLSSAVRVWDLADVLDARASASLPRAQAVQKIDPPDEYRSMGVLSIDTNRERMRDPSDFDSAPRSLDVLPILRSLESIPYSALAHRDMDMELPVPQSLDFLPSMSGLGMPSGDGGAAPRSLGVLPNVRVRDSDVIPTKSVRDSIPRSTLIRGTMPSASNNSPSSTSPSKTSASNTPPSNSPPLNTSPLNTSPLNTSQPYNSPPIIPPIAGSTQPWIACAALETSSQITQADDIPTFQAGARSSTPESKTPETSVKVTNSDIADRFREATIDCGAETTCSLALIDARLQLKALLLPLCNNNDSLVSNESIDDAFEQVADAGEVRVSEQTFVGMAQVLKMNITETKRQKLLQLWKAAFVDAASPQASLATIAAAVLMINLSEDAVADGVAEARLELGAKEVRTNLRSVAKNRDNDEVTLDEFIGEAERCVFDVRNV